MNNMFYFIIYVVYRLGSSGQRRRNRHQRRRLNEEGRLHAMGGSVTHKRRPVLKDKYLLDRRQESYHRQWSSADAFHKQEQDNTQNRYPPRDTPETLEQYSIQQKPLEMNKYQVQDTQHAIRQNYTKPISNKRKDNKHKPIKNVNHYQNSPDAGAFYMRDRWWEDVQNENHDQQRYTGRLQPAEGIKKETLDVPHHLDIEREPERRGDIKVDRTRDVSRRWDGLQVDRTRDFGGDDGKWTDNRRFGQDRSNLERNRDETRDYDVNYDIFDYDTNGGSEFDHYTSSNPPLERERDERQNKKVKEREERWREQEEERLHQVSQEEAAERRRDFERAQNRRDRTPEHDRTSRQERKRKKERRKHAHERERLSRPIQRERGMYKR